jgi:hypothetical protein
MKCVLVYGFSSSARTIEIQHSICEKQSFNFVCILVFVLTSQLRCVSAVQSLILFLWGRIYYFWASRAGHCRGLSRFRLLLNCIVGKIIRMWSL